MIGLVRGKAVASGWPFAEVDRDDATIARVIDEEERVYRGRAKGLVVHPHPEAEPLHFVFGDDLFMQDYCKTQFAGAEAHISVVALLRRIAPHFERLEVTDEGEFWETEDEGRLRELMAGFGEALSRVLAGHPNARVKVRLPSGRIIDALR